jgi:hypothetical protein
MSLAMHLCGRIHPLGHSSYTNHIYQSVTMSGQLYVELRFTFVSALHARLAWSPACYTQRHGVLSIILRLNFFKVQHRQHLAFVKQLLPIEYTSESSICTSLELLYSIMVPSWYSSADESWPTCMKDIYKSNTTPLWVCILNSYAFKALVKIFVRILSWYYTTLWM